MLPSPEQWCFKAAQGTRSPFPIAPEWMKASGLVFHKTSPPCIY